MFSEEMAGSYTKKEFGVGPEEQTLLKECNGNPKILLSSKEPVRLSPEWEGTNRPDDELNFKGITMDQAVLELNPPRDRLNIIYWIMVLHGIGSLMPWNMFMTAKDYFDKHKLSKEYIGHDTDYADNFLTYIGTASQLPNVLFNWLNVFFSLGGNLSTRIVWGISIEAVMFVLTVILAMIDTSGWPGIFFWTTMALIFILNTAGGVYQNSVFGMAAKLPIAYTGAVIFGANISGTITSLLSYFSKHLTSKDSTPNYRTAAIYYFITALFVLLACFDTYFALPINRFYRYHELIYQKEVNKKKLESGKSKLKISVYWTVFKQCWLQCFNVWFVFFVTLSIFPSIQSYIKPVSDDEAIVNSNDYTDIMCYFTFNISAMLGSLLASWYQWPGRRSVTVFVLLRALFIPLFLFCNYQPRIADGITRSMPVYITNDWTFLAIGIAMGLSSGYFSSVAMMYCPKFVEPQYSSIAGMYGAAFLVTGVLCGVLFSGIMPSMVSTYYNCLQEFIDSIKPYFH